jgi:poly(A) polymerase
MLKRILGIFQPRSTPSPQIKLQIIPRDNHSVSRKQISASALKVLYRLNEAGYEAFLVGGSVRDLLLGITPKDFDVATNATPEQVRHVFKNCRLIGRRFRLAHVHFGPEIIEVATFRSSHDKGEESEGRTSDHGQILRDNVYGNQQEDAIRRDFTINALYYSVKDFSVHDYAGGMTDIQQRMLRMIGDPGVRYREDPVRILRVIRFAAKLDFNIAPETANPIPSLVNLLSNVPPARLFDEILKLFMAGHGVKTLHLLMQYGLLGQLVPDTAESLTHHTTGSRLIELALQSTDDRVQAGKPVTPAFLFAALLWPPVQAHYQRLMQGHDMPPMQAMHSAAYEVIERQIKVTALPKRFSIPMREIWEMQLRISKRQGRRSTEMLRHPRFRAAYDFLLLREQSGEHLDNMGKWWTELQRANPNVEIDHSLLSEEGDDERSAPRKKRRRRPRKRPPASQ